MKSIIDAEDAVFVLDMNNIWVDCLDMSYHRSRIVPLTGECIPNMIQCVGLRLRRLFRKECNM